MPGKTNSFTLHGWAEFREALRTLPAYLTGEAAKIVDASANSAAVAIRTEYGRHSRTGNLQAGVVVELRTTGRFGLRAMVWSKAKHAHLFEYGTEARHYITQHGEKHPTGRMWGKTPAAPVFIPTMRRTRRDMYARLKDLLVRQGLLVTGDPDA
jgi:hypothetical protein